MRSSLGQVGPKVYGTATSPTPPSVPPGIACCPPRLPQQIRREKSCRGAGRGGLGASGRKSSGRHQPLSGQIATQLLQHQNTSRADPTRPRTHASVSPP
ncbi:hypothetical protein E2C01_011729 [Portunus trituberculatus]|uniref:Uncharacterized protein n=1 Tax=Portunus trituberculatus TaxID=210409 RepID=A0A5B7DCR3_PORTR|nr:hypothetical protein [Portunus trituberculatus]